MFDALLELLSRQWHDLLERPSRPMSFRFIVQPVMAAFFAMRESMRDARVGRSPDYWSILLDRNKRGPRLREGLSATSSVVLLGFAMDATYHALRYPAFYPVEALIVAAGIGLIPYILLRGPAAHISHRWHHRHDSHQPAGSKSRGA